MSYCYCPECMGEEIDTGLFDNPPKPIHESNSWTEEKNNQTEEDWD